MKLASSLSKIRIGRDVVAIKDAAKQLLFVWRYNKGPAPFEVEPLLQIPSGRTAVGLAQCFRDGF